MTNNTAYLVDILGKRIARGETSAQDLALLNRLLRLQQRRCLLCGAMVGLIGATAGYLLVLLASH